MLKNPNDWKKAADRLGELLNSEVELGDALRNMREIEGFSVLDLIKSVSEVCNMESSDAARIVAREVTIRSI